MRKIRAMYTEKDIKFVKAKEAIKKRPEMYFGSRGINVESICSYVVEGALVLGAQKTQISLNSGWHFICADIDWMSIETELPEVNEHSLFERILGFPEIGVNSFRWEALTQYFSDATFTTSHNKTRCILGSESDKTEYLSCVNSIGQWGRIIGFKFNKNA